jgi:DNA repair exonuclease SbcCD ATPase subunit
MTQFKPTLLVKRLVVSRNSNVAYDEQFHIGVNVVRGQNSSGKSTILNFLYYGLGGDLSDWSDKALLCTHVTVEAEFNGIVATLRREIVERSGAPMEIFGGSYEASLRAPRSQWIKYPYSRSQSQESFSQAIFRLLDLPEALNDRSGALTIHQILRLLYADQLSPIDKLFRAEGFDQASKREAIGRLLCGAYTGDWYNNDILIKDYSKQFDTIEAELKGLIAALGANDVVPNYEWIEATRRNLQIELNRLNDEMEEAERRVYVADDPSARKISLADQNAAYNAVRDLQEKIVEQRRQYDKLSFDIADSAKFISTLRDKIDALRDAAMTANHFGIVRFQTCPACYSVLEDTDETKCHLCCSPFDHNVTRDRIAALINENSIQIKQSEVLQRRRVERQEALLDLMRQTQDEWSAASERLASLQRLPSSEARRNLRELQRKIGYTERQIEDVDAKARTISKIGELSQKKENLQREIDRLKHVNDAIVESQKKQLAKAKTAIAEEIIKLLKNDLRRQDTFEDADYINFTFRGDEITVNGQNYFSASSRAILKSSFVVGFLAAAARDPAFRHPRFVMIDILENMGVEAERSRNFQLQLRNLSDELPADHQIIYATAMIAPEMDNEAYTVGSYSTLDVPTLEIHP